MSPFLRLALLCVFSVVLRATDEPLAVTIGHAKAHPQGDVPSTFVAADYRGDLRDLPIGVFDSGVGGLTVLEALKAHDRHDNRTGKEGADGVPDFAGERFVYFGDQANMPYGNYSAVGRTDFLRELILRDVLFLLGRRYVHGQKPPVKAIVIACNTATAYGLEDIRAAVKAWGLPVIVVGVVEAGAQGEHKIQRGYLPVPTYSAHWIAHPGLSRAVDEFLARERPAMEREMAALATLSPFRQADETA